MKKIDIIIPTYKDKQNLYPTLRSIGNNDSVQVVIVDDCSGTDFTDIIQEFQGHIDIITLSTPKNMGPGMARQYGIDNSSSKYIIFMDCGDEFVTPESLNDMLAEIEKTDFNIISFAHYQENIDKSWDIVPPDNNRVHGKIYNRQFLQKYNIRFNPNCARVNEDIGFNMICRLICNDLVNKHNLINGNMGFYEKPTVVWKFNENSLTKKNNCAFYYKEQNMGLAKNACYVIAQAKSNGVDENDIENYAYDIFAYLYLYYLSTLHGRPEYLNEAFDGAFYFYHNYFGKLQYLDLDKLKYFFYNGLVALISDENDPIRNEIITINLYDFILMMQEKEKEISNSCVCEKN